MSSKPFSVAVTGGIGSGKSYFCRMLAEKGFPVFSCDEEAHRIMKDNTDVRSALIRLIGEDLYNSSGELYKPMLRAWLCCGADHAARINAIVWPAVAEAFRKWTARQTSAFVFMECALLFESGFDRLVACIVVVNAPVEVRLSRVMQRDGVTLETARKWMSLQMSESEKIARADFVVLNDGVTPLRPDTLLKQLAIAASKEKADTGSKL